MQHIENDMDELFRKAAENYPLKTEAQNWDDIAVALVPVSVVNTSGKKGKKKYTWLFLIGFLFLVSAVSIKIFHNKDQSSYFEPVTANPNNENIVAEVNVKQDNSATSTKNAIPENLIVQLDDAKYSNVPRHQTARQVVSSAKRNVEQVLAENMDTKKVSTSGVEKLDAEEVSTNAVSEIVPSQNQAGKYIDKLREVEQKNETLENKKPTVSDSLTKIAGESPKPEKTRLSINKKGFYIGAVFGPQVNEVKGQGFTKTGFSAGILTGYRFAKRFSVETGILYSNKHYFSDGKYFDMTKASSTMPLNMKVISLNGSSSIFEIPVKFKYDFVTKNKSNWFIASGVSSYILTKESNNYIALISGVQQNLASNYKNKRGYFLATFNLSIGNEFKIGNNQTKIRIEPYLQMPLHGIGIGAMPVYSAGLHIGITLPVKK
jgi:hypothetical protein